MVESVYIDNFCIWNRAKSSPEDLHFGKSATVADKNTSVPRCGFNFDAYPYPYAEWWDVMSVEIKCNLIGQFARQTSSRNTSVSVWFRIHKPSASTSWSNLCWSWNFIALDGNPSEPFGTWSPVCCLGQLEAALAMDDFCWWSPLERWISTRRIALRRVEA